jgi:hypothetical protein
MYLPALSQRRRPKESVAIHPCRIGEGEGET